jgi:hypothetical protein
MAGEVEGMQSTASFVAADTCFQQRHEAVLVLKRSAALCEKLWL